MRDALTGKGRPGFGVRLPALLHDANDRLRAVLYDVVHVGPVPGFDAHYQLWLADGV